MPREATNEYIGMKRRANQTASREKRREILIEVFMGGYSKGYAISLLSGSEKFREMEGHGKKFGEEVAKWLKAVWFDAGCMCTTYFKTVISEWVTDYSERAPLIPPHIPELLAAMNASTMDRILKGVKREKLGSLQRNYRSGATTP